MTQQHSAAADNDEIDLMALLAALARQKNIILGSIVLGGALSVTAALLQPAIYTSTTRILPPQQQSSGMSALLGQLGGLAGMAGGAAGLKNPNDLYIGMLQSRTVADKLIQRLKLKERYEAETMDAARKSLQAASSISAGKDGMLAIAVDDKDPQFAATLANGYVEELANLNQSLAVTDAAKRRLFFERQLKSAKEQLAEAETALQKTQESTGLIQPDGQVQAIMSAVAQLRGAISAKEVQLEAMKSFATEQNPQYQRTQQELVGLKAQLAKLESGKGAEGDIMVPTGKVPKTGLEYLRKLRDVKYNETIFELLSKQYEMARIDEAKDSSLIQVLDKAEVPELKSKPKRSLIVAVGLMAGLMLGTLLALLRDKLQRASPESRQRARELALAFKGR